MPHAFLCSSFMRRYHSYGKTQFCFLNSMGVAATAIKVYLRTLIFGYILFIILFNPLHRAIERNPVRQGPLQSRLPYQRIPVESGDATAGLLDSDI